MSPMPTESAIAEKRQQILQGAMEIFLHQGYEGTSMDRVATAARVSKITIYKHFEDKEGLFKALIEQIAEQRFNRVLEVISLETEPEDMLRRIATQVLQLIASDEQYVAFFRLIMGESGRFPELAQLFVRALPQRVWKVLSHYFATHPRLDIANPEATARIFTGTVISYAMTQYILHGEQIAPMPSDVLIESLVHLIVNQASS